MTPCGCEYESAQDPTGIQNFPEFPFHSDHIVWFWLSLTYQYICMYGFTNYIAMLLY